MEEGLLATASVGRTHGYEGFLLIHPYSGETDHLKRLGKCIIVCRDGRRVEVRVIDTKEHSYSFLMRFSGYESKERAALLSGGRMFIRREDGPVLDEGEYYIADLFGLSLVCSGKVVGTVESVCDGAQADYLMVRKSDGQTILVPNMEPFVSRPDFENGTIELLNSSLLEI